MLYEAKNKATTLTGNDLHKENMYRNN